MISIQPFFLLVLFGSSIFCAEISIGWEHIPTDIKLSIARTVTQGTPSASYNSEKSLSPKESFDGIKTAMKLTLTGRQDSLLVPKYRRLILECSRKGEYPILMASFGSGTFKEIVMAHLQRDYPEEFWGRTPKTPESFQKLIKEKPSFFRYTFQVLKELCDLPVSIRENACINFITAVSGLITQTDKNSNRRLPISKLFFSPEEGRYSLNEVCYKQCINQLISNRHYGIIKHLTITSGWPLFSGKEAGSGQDHITLLNNMKSQSKNSDEQQEIQSILDSAFSINFSKNEKGTFQVHLFNAGHRNATMEKEKEKSCLIL